MISSPCRQSREKPRTMFYKRRDNAISRLRAARCGTVQRARCRSAVLRRAPRPWRVGDRPGCLLCLRAHNHWRIISGHRLCEGKRGGGRFLFGSFGLQPRCLRLWYGRSASPLTPCTARCTHAALLTRPRAEHPAARTLELFISSCTLAISFSAIMFTSSPKDTWCREVQPWCKWSSTGRSWPHRPRGEEHQNGHTCRSRGATTTATVPAQTHRLGEQQPQGVILDVLGLRPAQQSARGG